MAFKLNIPKGPLPPTEPAHTPAPELTPEQEQQVMQAAESAMQQMRKVTANVEGTEQFLVERAVLYLDGLCDGAASLDGQGFNGRDTAFGKSMAEQLRNGKRLSWKQLDAAYRMLNTYMNTQLGWLDRNALAAEKIIVQKLFERKGAQKQEREWERVTAEMAYMWLAEGKFDNVLQKDRGFVSSLAASYKKNKKLTQSQLEWARRMTAQYANEELLNSSWAVPEETVAPPSTPPAPTQTAPKVGFKFSPSTVLPPKPAESTPAPAPAQPAPVPAAPKASPKVSFSQFAGARKVQPTPQPQPAEPVKPKLSFAMPGVVTSVSRQLDRAAGMVTPEQAMHAATVVAKQREIISFAKEEYEGIPILRFMRAGQDVEIQPDPSQWAAIKGMREQMFACLTGAAGTGKTTVTRALLQALEGSLGAVDIARYGTQNRPLDEQEKEPEAVVVPRIAFAAFTGKAMQQMKRALPDEYHRNCFTIHSMLGYYPEMFDVEEWSDEEQRVVLKSKRRFVPYYTAAIKMPWDIIVLDEGSMIPIPLWNEVFAAMRHGCRVFMVGDINQLPPVHGRSVFGFAMLNWPSFELKHIHRQKGEDNPIVENAWRVLNGQFPQPVPGRFDMVRIDAKKSEAYVIALKAAMLLHQRGEFNPFDTDERQGDMFIVSQNKDTLGQVELNQRFITYFNPPKARDAGTAEGVREIVIAGYERKNFAIGDKVMATVNNHDIGITNGMTGRITDIRRNSAFQGVIGKMQLTATQIEDILSGQLTLEAEPEKEKPDENIQKRAASHILTIDFGLNSDGSRRIVDFKTVGEVNSLIFAYAATCHKCQGSEFPTVVILCHSSNHRMLYREWLYTALTRASYRVVLLYDDRGLNLAVSRQRIKGTTLEEKARAFNEVQEDNTATLPDLPIASRWISKEQQRTAREAMYAPANALNITESRVWSMRARWVDGEWK